MSSKITSDVVDALQHCRLKAYYQLRGEQGIQSGYEKLLIEQRANHEPKIIEKIQREYCVREISFLKFLLSQERDMDAFAVGKRRRRRSQRIELYPKGYLPPSIISLRRGRTAQASDAMATECK